MLCGMTHLSKQVTSQMLGRADFFENRDRSTSATGLRF